MADTEKDSFLKLIQDTSFNLKLIGGRLVENSTLFPDDLCNKIFAGIEGLDQIEAIIAKIDPASLDSIPSTDDFELAGMPTDPEEQVALMRQWLDSPDIPEEQKAMIREVLG
jgi:hypothetical protein